MANGWSTIFGTMKNAGGGLGGARALIPSYRRHLSFDRPRSIPFFGSGLGLDSAAMELAPLIRPEMTKVTTGLTMPRMPSMTGNSNSVTGNSNSAGKRQQTQGLVQGQEGQKQPEQGQGSKGPSLPQPAPSSSSPFSVPTPPPTYADASSSPLFANAKTKTESGT